ncbi:uncharacterized protein LOC106662003 [Cimex lectularius]|uniref:Uncharacterized protein n=1 Tax=Cimex lectularius TaxID=79782 RepID=A0A8I6RDM2_CIMLE|nr:uncharacterized protein LOC106662003 [Cimex lectularius]
MWRKKKKPLIVEEKKKEEEPKKKRVPNFHPHDVCNAPQVYKYMAGHVVARELYEAGIRLYTIAEEVSRNTVDKAYDRIKRSQCHLALCDIPKAREDATKAMELCPEMLYLHFQNGNVLYNENLFENSLMTYEYGSKQRTFPDLFGNGVNIATGTLENCVGGNAGPMLSQECLGKIIVALKLQEMGIKEIKKKELNEIQKKRNEMIVAERKRHYSEKYLGMIAREKLHMIDMLMSSALFGSNTVHNKVMENMLINTVEKLEVLQDCLWRRKPLYVFAHKRGKPAPKHLKEIKQEAILKAHLMVRDIARQMNLVLVYYNNKDWGACYKLCEHIRAKLWRMPDIKGVNKDECVEQLIDVLGDMYFAMKAMHPDWPQKWNDKRILCILGITQNMFSAKEVAKYGFHYPVYNAHQRIKDYLEGIMLTNSQYQKMFFNFEISCLYSMIHNLPQMRSFARQAVFTARKEGNIIWYINCLFLLARTDFEEGNILEGIVSLTAIREACFKYGFPMQEKFAERGIVLLHVEMSKEKLVGGVRGSVNRAKNIIDLMPNADLRSRARTLIWQVNKKPPWKRMPLVKGVAVAVQDRKQGPFEGELAREEERRLKAKKLRKVKRAQEEALAAAESLAAQKGEGYNLLAGTIKGVDPAHFRLIVDAYRRRSTFNLDMFHQ